MNTNISRLQVVDALRGFAIVSIMLLHNIEHFDFLFWPENLPLWMVRLDKGIMETMYFLFGGKSYAIFALLFGLTFFIQHERQEKLGYDFRGRFAWRLVILMVFAFINSAFYEGDILSIYAVLGFFLIPVARLSNRTVFIIALIFMLQPIEWISFFINMQNPDAPVYDPKSWAYFGKAGEYITKSSLPDTLIGNLTNGKIAVILWSWEKGRILQNIALFMFGMLAGRKQLFVQTDNSTRIWKKTLPFAVVSFIALFTVQKQLAHWVTSPLLQRNLDTIISSYANMAFMLIWVSGFVLLFQSKIFHKPLNALSPMGRMSLSNYMIQSLLGSLIYYGFGLGLYKYTGSTYCILIGIILAVFQGLFSAWWMKSHKQGPLETLWHKATWIGYNSKISKQITN
jgi:uncharacterized protein